MTIPVPCPHCATVHHLGEMLAGRTLDCPNCKGSFTVPMMVIEIPDAPSSIADVQSPILVATPISNDAISTQRPGPTLSPPHWNYNDQVEDRLALEDLQTRPHTGLGRPSAAMLGILITGAVNWVFLSVYVGMAALIVAFFAVVVGAIFGFITSGRRRAMVPAGAIQAGHALWMLLGATLVAAGAAKNVRLASNLIFLEGGLFFLAAILVILIPRLIPVVVLMGYQVYMFVLNFINLNESGDVEFGKALLLHLALRVLGVALMLEAYFRKTRADGRPNA